MPNGIPNDDCHCPIARALQPVGVTSVSGGEMDVDVRNPVTDHVKSVSVWGPAIFDEFVEQFDNEKKVTN